MATVTKMHLPRKVLFVEGGAQSDAENVSKQDPGNLILHAEQDDGGTWKLNAYFQGSLLGSFTTRSKLDIAVN